MDHHDHVELLRRGVQGPDENAVWADLGSGGGAFTLALADLLGPRATIYSVDRDAGAFREQARAMRRFPDVRLEQIVGDFTRPLPLPPLDGIVMANSLHFVRDKLPVLALVRACLAAGGRLILVEYDADAGNHWVPFPLSFETWRRVAREAGFREPERIGRVPSRFLGAIYSALTLL